MNLAFPALGPVTVVADSYVPRTISLDDGPRPFGVRVRSTVFVGPETYAEIAGGSHDLVVFCLDCLPEPVSEPRRRCTHRECRLSSVGSHDVGPDCAELDAAGVVKENRQGGPKDDRERGVEVTGGARAGIEFSRPGVNL